MIFRFSSTLILISIIIVVVVIFLDPHPNLGIFCELPNFTELLHLNYAQSILSAENYS